MEEKKIVVDKPVKVAGLTLVPITQVSLSLSSARAGTAFLAIKRPVAVVVVLPQVKKAFRITGEEASFEQLIQEIPSLEEVLATFNI
jgi:uncharacterized spore protein YtfJ